MKKHKKIIFAIILIIILIIFGILLKGVDAYSEQDDILFFKLFGGTSTSASNGNNEKSSESSSESNNIVKEIVFDMSDKNSETKNINLLETVNTQFLVKEKIARGSKGNFLIKIISNKKYKEAQNYRVAFKSENEKPHNLYFYINNNDEQKYTTLEDMQNAIEKDLNDKNQKEIIINWEWKYNNSNEGNKQDTLDGMRIKEYNFNIDITAT